MSIASALELSREIAERLHLLGPIATGRFFGGAALKLHGVQFAFVMKGSLYLRVDDESRNAFEALGAVPFAYSGISKTVTVASYYEAPAEILDDVDVLSDWAVHAHSAALAFRPKRALPRKKSPR
ncbi:TfoX/Sxy family protein [Rhizobium sp. LjRoot254]|uniref:TfoX/Sxy family protein n=1 Tax=Rhizobium sp. LjRoot254 TaxID=3342297 RepID=UPI003ECEB9B9